MEFLREFLKLNEDLLRERGQEPSLRRQAADLYQRIGDLEAQRDDVTDGVAAYQKAIALFHGLIADAPDGEQDRLQLAYTFSQLAQLQRRARLYPQARQAYEEAIALRKQLVKDFPLNPIHRYRTASYHFALADLLDEWGKAKEAENFYRLALKDQEQLVEDQPAQAPFREDLLRSAGSLAVLLDPSRPEEARQLLERILRAERDEARTKPAYLTRVVNSGYDLAAHLRARGRHADLARLAADLTREFSTSGEIHYHATCYAARAVKALDLDKALAPAERARLADTYVRQAVELLRRAVQLGWKDRQHMFLDGDLDPLRPRQEFRDLLAELDRRIGRPLVMEQLVSYLANRYKNEQMQIQAIMAGAQTVAERKKAGANLPRPEEFAQRCLSLAEDHPRDSAAVSALAQVLLITSSDPMKRRAATPKLRARAFELLERDHLQTPAFADVCTSLGSAPSAAGDRLLQTAFEKHALPEVRARAGFWLAQSLASQAAKSHTAGSDDAAKLFGKAEELYERVARDYAGVDHGSTTLGEAARAQLHALRHLSVGRPAEDIRGSDLKGEAMKLSDHRGKVVMLSFWANWCGFCRQMYPHEKALVKRYAGRPFALVGVNGDNDMDELRREMKRHGITWRSWADTDGRIRTRWQTEVLPEIFILDHKGVIRHRFTGMVRGNVLEEAIDKLLAECQKDTTKQ
jgi:thiol-disulfide isomerase/thioredoxin